MAPKKPEPKKDALKPSMEPEAGKELDFDPRSIKVCLPLSLCHFVNQMCVKASD